MKIYQVHTRETADTITIFAKCKIRRVGYDEVYFTFDKKYKKYLQVDASPFAAALLLPSMKQGEDLVVEGKISKKLYEGMQQIMAAFLSWDIGLKPIKIITDGLVADTANPKTTATFFSGGVDSFYTYLNHRDDSSDPVTHLLLVKGFDIDPRNEKLWDATLRNVRKIAKAEKVGLIETETNIRPLIDPILPWAYSHGGCLAAIGLSLRKGLKKVYISASGTLDQQEPWGTHPETDSMWNTEKLSFFHDGIEVSRVDKVARQIAKSPTALKYLRVCYKNEKDAYNCGMCDKCLRTMVNLYLAGVLDRAETFPHSIDLARIASIRMRTGTATQAENLEALEARGVYPELQEALRVRISNGVDDPKPLKRLSANIIYLDHVYARGNLFSIMQRAFGRKY
jgi:hypothetical protein